MCTCRAGGPMTSTMLDQRWTTCHFPKESQSQEELEFDTAGKRFSSRVPIFIRMRFSALDSIRIEAWSDKTQSVHSAAQRSSSTRPEACGTEKGLVFWQTTTCATILQWNLNNAEAPHMKLRDNPGSEQAQRNDVRWRVTPKIDHGFDEIPKAVVDADPDCRALSDTASLGAPQEFDVRIIVRRWEKVQRWVRITSSVTLPQENDFQACLLSVWKCYHICQLRPRHRGTNNALR